MPPDLATVKARQQEMWATGNYARIGNTLVLMAELLCEAVDPRAGQRVLDVATGSGNAALAFARRFCRVVGVDYVPALLDEARRRAAAERLDATFELADAEDLPYPDASFDIVVSTIGAMFAPNQQQVANELLRVVRPGGVVGMANWTPESFAGQLFVVAGTYLPPAPALQPPARWGTEQGLRELFGDRIGDLRLTRRRATMRFRSEDEYVALHRETFPPIMRLFQILDEPGRSAFERDFRALAQRFNRFGDETLAIENEYLEVVGFRLV